MQIEKNVPLPKLRKQKAEHAFSKNGGWNRIYPFNEMAIGDSFLAAQQLSKRVSDAAYQYSKFREIKFTGRKVFNGYRIWRIK